MKICTGFEPRYTQQAVLQLMGGEVAQSTRFPARLSILRREFYTEIFYLTWRSTLMCCVPLIISSGNTLRAIGLDGMGALEMTYGGAMVADETSGNVAVR